MQIPNILLCFAAVSRSTCAIIPASGRFVKRKFEKICRFLEIRESPSSLFFRLRSVLFQIDRDVLNFAVEDFAERIDGVGADVLIFAQTAQLPRTEMVVLEQLILRDAAFLHCLPKRVVSNHKYHTILGRIDNYSIRNRPDIDN